MTEGMNSNSVEAPEQYDYLIVGAGLTAAVFAHEATRAGKRCLVIDRRNHIAGNVYTENVAGVQVHTYGAHIFHTSDMRVWNYVNRFADFNHYVNSPVANYKGEIYNLPFNMNTFSKMWGISTPAEAKEIIARQREEAGITEPQNLEEQALSLVGEDIYRKLIKEYTEKQWGRDCSELPSFIIKRLPVRFVYDNNYFNDCYQGIPKAGYTKMVKAMLWGADVRLNCEFAELIKEQPNIAKRIIYTGPIDEYFNYELGQLEYRSLRFETEVLEGVENYQGNAVVNYTSHNEAYTRIIEHKHFTFAKDEKGNSIPDTVITKEYPSDWHLGDEPYYPVNNERNAALYEQYCRRAESEANVVFAGRLGAYKYYDMAPCIAAAFDLVEAELGIRVE